jgi:macrolide-specific efflux system membrane fusion protein
VQSAEAALLSAQAQVEALKAQIDQAESNLRADEANLDYARIYAPISGTVVSFTARQGQTLNAIQQAPVIMRIADLSTMTVQTQVSEADVSRLCIGMNAYFTTLGSEGRRWYGVLRKIEPTPVVQNNVVLYNALFDVPNPNLALMTQMTAQVFFVVASAKDALLVPMSALASKAPRGDRKPGATAVKTEARPAKPDASAAAQGAKSRNGSVRVLLADGTIQDRAVEIGVSNRVQAQVLSGLEEGENVVTGANAAPPGAPRRTPRL